MPEARGCSALAHKLVKIASSGRMQKGDLKGRGVTEHIRGAAKLGDLLVLAVRDLSWGGLFQMQTSVNTLPLEFLGC